MALRTAIIITPTSANTASHILASPKATRAQYDKLVEMAAKVRQAGFDPGMLHAANSAALFRCDLPSLDGVRIGSAIGGRTTAKGDTGLQKTGRLESQVAEVRWLPAGHGVGYGPAFVTKRPTKIAVIPVGYSDGFMVEKGRDAFRFRDSLRYALGDMAKWLRRKKFYVTVGNRRVRVLGHVGLNHTTVDVTDIDCQPGEIALFDVSPMFVPPSIPRVYR